MSDSSGPAVVTIGAFDGIHRGHRALLRGVVARARALGVLSRCITFDPHPDLVLFPSRGFTYLADLQDKVEEIRAAGVDDLWIMPFTPDLSRLTPEEFLGLVETRGPVVELWVGTDFAMGKGRAGDVPRLAELGRARGFALHVVPPERDHGDVISSSLIRTLLAQGNVARANELLGRAYRIRGTVVEGDRRGVAIGFPTANIAIPTARTMPADGVYVACARGPGLQARAMVNVGARPTFGDDRRLIEAHLLDFQGDLYGQELTLDFLDRLRDIQRFLSVADLIAQLERDRELTRAHPALQSCCSTT